MKAIRLVALLVCVVVPESQVDSLAKTADGPVGVYSSTSTEQSSGYEGSGDTGSGDTASKDDGDDGLTDGQLAAIVVSSIIGAVLVGLLLYFLISVYCPVMRVSSPSFSPVVSLASQPIVVRTS